MAQLAIRLLGGLEMRLASKGIVGLPTKKSAAVLAFLARHPGRSVPREKLATMLWGRSDDAHARMSLRQTLTLLRRSLAEIECPCIIGHNQGLCLDGQAADVDVAAFDHLCRQHSLEALAQAGRLYRGEFLEGFTLQEELFEEWLRSERMSLHECAVDALTRLLRRHLDSADAEQGARVARKLLSLDPLSETAHRALMRMYAEMGDRVMALKQFQACCEVLKVELGVQPGAETHRLHQEIRKELEATHLQIDVARPPDVLPLPDRPSIAVLPFLDLTVDGTQARLGNDLANNIITELSRFRSWSVASRRSSLAYRGNAVNIQEIGRKLGVRYVVTGTVGNIGGRTRVSADLVDARTGLHCWADRYDRPVAGEPDVQDELVGIIVSTIDHRLEAAEKSRAEATSEATRTSYDFYLLAAAAEERNTKQSYHHAETYLHRAIKLNPGLTQAYRHLSLVNFFASIELWAGDRNEALDTSFAIAREALARDDSDSMAHAHLGMLYLYRRGFDEAADRFAQALRLNPSDCRVRGLFGLFLTAIGRTDEALEQFDHAERLNPLGPSWIKRLKGMAYFSADRWADAIGAFRANVSPMNQDRGWLAASCALAGRPDEARKHLEAFLGAAAREMAAVPSLGAEGWRSCWHPIEYLHEQDFDRLFDGLRQAGLPK